MSKFSWTLAVIVLGLATPQIAFAQLPIPVPLQGAGLVRDILPSDTAFRRAVALDNAGQTGEAVEILKRILQKAPAEFRSLDLLERALGKLDKRPEMIPYVTRAVQLDSTGLGIMGVAIKVYGGLLLPDSARKYAMRWLAKVPEDGQPFREWADAATAVRDRAGAMAALEEGRRLIGKPNALAADIAQAAQMGGNYSRAVQEWLKVLVDEPQNRVGAVYVLAQVPPTQRTAVFQELQRANTSESRWVTGLLQVRWGQVNEGTVAIRTSLPSNATQALALLDDLRDMLENSNDRAALLAKATVLEAMSQRELGAAVLKTRLEAATAYANAGSDRDARRMLALVSSDPSAPKGASLAASTTMVGVLIAEGKAAEAEAMLDSLKTNVGDEERDAFRYRIAMLWARQEEFARAERVIGADSSTAGVDVLGRIRLFRGDLAGATEAFRYAGPFDDVRKQAVSRVKILALLQSIGLDSSARLGAAFLAMERHDSSTALRILDSLASSFTSSGAAETRLLAGQLSAGTGDTARALALFTAADLPELPGTAAAARLERARLLAARGQREEARKLAESIILDFPESAVLPDARRLRDEVRGALPIKVP